MARKISQRELRKHSGSIVRALDAGESFLLTRNDVPVGELRPVAEAQFVRTEKPMASAIRLPSIDAKRFHEDVDAFIDQDPEPRT